MLTGAEPSNKPINYPLWFVRDLIILVLLAPMLYHIIKKFSKKPYCAVHNTVGNIEDYTH